MQPSDHLPKAIERQSKIMTSIGGHVLRPRSPVVSRCHNASRQSGVAERPHFTVIRRSQRRLNTNLLRCFIRGDAAVR